MGRKTWRFGDFSLTVEVPQRLSRLTGRLRHQRDHLPPGGLLVSKEIPEIDIERRDPEASVEYFREQNPDTEGASAETTDEDDLASRIQSFDWYHTIELPGGVVTEGVYDHRPLVPYYALPEDLSGRSVLDVATFDGFWAFEFEKRGADVVAVDLPRLTEIDFPQPIRDKMLETGMDRAMGKGFGLAAEALGSSVERKWMNIYEIGPELGSFDVVHVADVLLHLERPLEALRAIRSVTRGEARIVDVFDPALANPEGRKLVHYLGGWWTVVWWIPSLDTLAQMVIDAGFSSVTVDATYILAKRGEREGFWRAMMTAKP